MWQDAGGSTLPVPPAEAITAEQGARLQHTTVGTREAVQGLWSHRSTTCSFHLQLLSSGSPSSQIRDVSIGKHDVVYGISSPQIRLVAHYESLMLLSSTRKTCVCLWSCFLETNVIKLDWWNYYPFHMSSLPAFMWSENYPKQCHLQLHECSDLSRCVPRSQKQPHHHVTQYSAGGRSCSASPEEGKPTCSQEYFLPPGIIIRQE